MLYTLVACISIYSLYSFADEPSESRFITKDQVLKKQMATMVPGLLSVFANKKNGNVERPGFSEYWFYE